MSRFLRLMTIVMMVFAFTSLASAQPRTPQPKDDILQALLSRQNIRSAPLEAMRDVDLSQQIANSDETLFVNVPPTWVFEDIGQINIATNPIRLNSNSFDTMETWGTDDIFIGILSQQAIATWGNTREDIFYQLANTAEDITEFFTYYEFFEYPVYFLSLIPNQPMPADATLFALIFEMRNDQFGVMIGLTGDYDQNEATILAIQQSVRYADIAPLVPPLDEMAKIDLPQIASNADETVFVNIPEMWVYKDERDFILASDASLMQKISSPAVGLSLNADEILLYILGDDIFGFFGMTTLEILTTLEGRYYIQPPFIPYDLSNGAIYFLEEPDYAPALEGVEFFSLMFQNPDGTTGMIGGMTGGSYADHEATVLAILQTIRSTP